MKVGLVLEGGFMRGAYVAGALRALADLGLKKFEVISAVSISTFSAAYFVTGQYAEMVHIWRNIVTSKDFIGWRVFLKHGRIYNINKLVFEVFTKQVPFAKQVFKDSATEVFFAVTNHETGEVEYLNNHTPGDIFYKMICATANFHVHPPKYKSGGQYYQDGGFVSPLTLDKAVAEGCDKIIFIRTKKEYGQEYDYLMPLTKYFWPKMYQAYLKRVANFKLNQELVEDLTKRGKILVIAPKNISRYERWTTKPHKLGAWVEMGYRECLEVFTRNQDFLPINDPKEFLAIKNPGQF
ncbi:MAG: patatin-like phospholipase family protein [Candidatus Buchananbacteria bacterium]